ncbi:MAG: fatty acid desaturase [Chitinophagaceae bacterium]|jgi:sphingolipid delta-4 desaturase|nr:MAG: fatty acid desaturase [Chitinophagaceae bacterium]
MQKPTDFYHSTGPEPHRIRTKLILKEHPEVRKLIGKNRKTFWAIFGIVSFQILLAYLLRDKPWWLMLIAAYLIGAFANHALFVMIHECAHNLIFKKKSLNTLSGILANLPQIFPSSVSFQRYHLKHHSFQGNHDLDADLPDFWEAKLINNSFWGKACWFLMYPVFQAIRTFRLKEIKPVDKWVILNWSVQIAFNVSIWLFIGPEAFLYLLLSFFFSVGLHPLGARWIQEHYLVLDEHQETYSYYGIFNKVAFNVGYHNEHHDFPSIPWNKLPELKQDAPDFYDNLLYHTSWTKLFFRFLFDKKLSLFSRMIRNNRGKIALTDESKPDAEIIKAISN